MGVLRHRLLSWRSMSIAAIAIAGCGGDDKSAEPPQELEDTLGFGGDSAKEIQARVENRIGDCMQAQGFDYSRWTRSPQQQAVTGKARITDEEFTKQFGYGISTLFGKGNQQSDPNERIRASLSAADRAAYDRALGGDNPGVTFAEAVDSGDFSELGGCTKEASDAAFGGAAVLNVAGREARRARRAHHPGPADGEGEREVVRVHAGEGLPLRGARRDRRGPERALQGDRRAPASGRARPRRPAGRELRPRRAHRAAARRRSGSRTPTSTARSRRSSRSSARCGPQYEEQFRKQNQRLLARVQPANQ